MLLYKEDEVVDKKPLSSKLPPLSSILNLCFWNKQSSYHWFCPLGQFQYFSNQKDGHSIPMDNFRFIGENKNGHICDINGNSYIHFNGVIFYYLSLGVSVCKNWIVLKKKKNRTTINIISKFNDLLKVWSCQSGHNWT